MKYHHASKPSSQTHTNKSAAPICLDAYIIAQQTCQNLYHKMKAEILFQRNRIGACVGRVQISDALMSGSRRNGQIKWKV